MTDADCSTEWLWACVHHVTFVRGRPCVVLAGETHTSSWRRRIAAVVCVATFDPTRCYPWTVVPAMSCSHIHARILAKPQDSMVWRDDSELSPG